MNVEQIPLRFAQHAVDAQTHVNLSAVRPDGACLWIAGDETATVERLTADGTMILLLYALTSQSGSDP